MSARSSALLVPLCLLAAGCRQDPYLDAYLETLRAEKLWLEDKFYDLQYQYDAKLAELDRYRRQNTELRRELGLDEQSPPRLEPPAGSGPGPAGELPDLRQPAIEFGTPAAPDLLRAGAPGSPPVDPAASGGAAQPADFQNPAPRAEPAHLPSSPEPFGRPVTHIVLNPYLTSGHDFDHQPGDDGIRVAIEPRNADDRYVPLAGAVSVVLLDPALKGEAARVARWDFEAAEITRRLSSSDAEGRGILLQLPWSDQPPKHSQLRLFVRYITQDGRKLQTDIPIELALPGQFSHRWTPKSGRSRAPATQPDQARSADGPRDTENSPDVSPRAGYPENEAARSSPASAGTAAASGTGRPSPNQPAYATKPSRSRRPVWRPFR